jgi:hypothetical protein
MRVIVLVAMLLSIATQSQAADWRVGSGATITAGGAECPTTWSITAKLNFTPSGNPSMFIQTTVPTTTVVTDQNGRIIVQCKIPSASCSTTWNGKSLVAGENDITAMATDNTGCKAGFMTPIDK